MGEAELQALAKGLVIAEDSLRWCGGSVASAIWAVSYTHLRAHETVLDLVCRLLLEQKKIQQHNS